MKNYRLKRRKARDLSKVRRKWRSSIPVAVQEYVGDLNSEFAKALSKPSPLWEDGNLIPTMRPVPKIV